MLGPITAPAVAGRVCVRTEHAQGSAPTKVQVHACG